MLNRYLGKAIFEGTEVADTDFDDLTDLREEEASEIEDAISDCESNIADLIQDTSDEIADLKTWRDQELDYRQAEYDAEIVELDWSLPFPPETIEAAEAAYDHYLSDCEDICSCYDDDYNYLIDESNSERAPFIRARDATIHYIHDSTTSQIKEIIDARYFLPVYMINNKPGACDQCIELNKIVATLSVLIDQDYIPPFHNHCRCFLTQAGYVVMSGTTPFHISELLSEAASGAGVGPTSLVPSLPPTTAPSDEEEYEKWLEQISAWWAFWTEYYPIPASTYLFHG